jgi:hypothetical protein
MMNRHMNHSALCDNKQRHTRYALDAMAGIMGLRQSAGEAFGVFVRSWSDLKAFERS